ncbi:MAG: bacillithiol biosynthesis deacetylase BshB1 [Ignavibacteria bacterium]|nr:bacillithiol biosynthesis deacetylase BshB1 [Ignavibacteria bacterium]
MKLDAIFFAAHPDDAELCCGGTIANLVGAGKKTAIIDLTLGELGTNGTVTIRNQEAAKAAKALGISLRENLRIPDGRIENTTENRLKIIRVIRKYRPDIIFFPHFHDRHPDHYHTHALVKEAAFASGLEKVSTGRLKAYRPKRNFYYMQSYPFEPNIITDISSTFKSKMNAIACYSSQFYTKGDKGPKTYINDKQFIEFISARSKFYGFLIGAEYGEPFYTEEKIRIRTEDLFNI